MNASAGHAGSAALVGALVAGLLLTGCVRKENPAMTVPPSPTAAASGAPSSPAPATRTVKIFLVAVGDDGKAGPRFGCSDSIVSADRTVDAAAPPVETAVRALLDDRADNDVASGHYNVFHESALTVTSGTIEGGKAVVRLDGQLNLRGVCDSPRVEEQLERTAGQFPGVTSVEVFVSGRPLADVFSQK